MADTHRPDLEQVARNFSDTLKEKNKLQDELIARLAPFEAAGWTIRPHGPNNSAFAELDGYVAEAYHCESGLLLAIRMHSFVCTDADEAIAFVEAVKRSLDGHRSDPSVFPGLPEPDTTTLRTIRP